MNALSELDRQILKDLFLQNLSGAKVERMKFRAEHSTSIAAINLLESNGFIRVTNDEYRTSVLSLAEIKAEEASALLDASELIYGQLRKHYREKQNALLSIQLLAERSNIDINTVCRALPYMVETSLYGGQTTGFPDALGAAIAVSEPVLEFDTFKKIVAFKQAQQTRMTSGFVFPSPQMNEVVQAQKPNPKNSTASPDWYEELKAPLPIVLREIYEARSSGHRVLPAMGVRAVIDVVCTEFSGDLRTFKDKLSKAQELQLLTAKECEYLYVVFDAGSASAHRGLEMDNDALTKLIEIMEHFLRTIFRLPQIVEEIKLKTPGRKV